MTDETILERLTAVIGDVLGLPDLVLSPATTAAEVPGWDSLAHVDLIVAVEGAFGLRFTTQEVMGLQKVGDLVALVSRKAR
jgi:acyl carrier protein